MLDHAEAAIAPSQEPATTLDVSAPPLAPRDPLWINTLLWLAIAAFIAVMGCWTYQAGMRIRDDAWAYSRSIRFHGDIANGIRWGSLVLRTAERVANTEDDKRISGSHPVARADPNPGDLHQRPLTIWELYRGVDQVYQDFVVGESPDGNYGLDYPPLRLFSMTLWTRAARRHVPDLQNWPGPWQLNYSETGDPAALVNEDIARPMLRANTYCIAIAAIAAFFLVWIWVNRGGRPALAQPRTGWTAFFAPRKRLVPWKPTPLRKINGLVLFAIAAPAFFYAVIIAENPVPAPPPTIAIEGRPILAHSADGSVSAIITAAIDGQGSDAQWFVDWGLTPRYGHQTSIDPTGADDVSTTLRDLPKSATIHYRITARNDHGLTHSDDLTLNTALALAPLPPQYVYGQVWLPWTYWVGIALLFIAMACAIHSLPPVHRGWAAGLVAALLMWLDPCVIVDTHLWPQWDAWVLPPFMLAALLTSLDWWFTAGLVLGVGVMFKGQTMLASPILMLWPLFSGRWGAVGRILTGFVLAAGLVLSPWLVLNNTPPQWTAGPLRWIGAVLAAAVVGGALSLYRAPVWRRSKSVWQELKAEWHGPQAPAAPAIPRDRTSLFDLVVFCSSLLAGILIITVLILKRWPSDSDLPRVEGLLLLLAVLILPWLLPRRALGVWLAAILGCSIWMSAYLYHGDWTWKTVGFEYGTRKFTRMALGNGMNGNLGQILETRFGWDIHDNALTLRLPDIADTLHLAKRTTSGAMIGWAHDWGLDGTPASLDIRQFEMALFVTLMVLIAIGASIHDRRNEARFLACLAAIWALMPNILLQMANRYEMWGAAISCMLIGISPGLTLLHFIFSLLGAGMIAGQLLNTDPSRSPMLHDLMSRFGPDDGWIMLTIAAVYFYIALVPDRRASPEELLLP